MSPRASDARGRVLTAAAEMLAQHGLNATSIREMAKRAETPLGSTYHHFPGGKQEVVELAIVNAGERIDGALAFHLQQGAAAGLRDFLAMWRERLLRSNFHLGCAVLAVAVEEPIDPLGDEVRDAASHAFSRWTDRLAQALVAEGADKTRAGEAATMTVAAVEGAVAMSRAARSIAPFDQVSRQLEHLIAGTVTVAKPVIKSG